MPVGETPEAHNKGKNVTYPTDAKLLHEKVIRKVLSIVKSLNPNRSLEIFASKM